MEETQVVTSAPNNGAAPDGGNAEPQVGEEKFDAKYVRELRAEAAEYRKKLRELEGKVKSEEDAKLTEQEKLQKKLVDLEKRNADAQNAMQAKTLRYEVMLAASKLGIVDPDAAYRLLDTSSLEFDDEGQPKNVEKALKNLLTNKPYLAGGAGHASAANPAGGARNVSDDPIIIAARKAAGLPALGDKPHG